MKNKYKLNYSVIDDVAIGQLCNNINKTLLPRYDISNSKTLNREMAALLEAGSETNCKRLLRACNWGMSHDILILYGKFSDLKAFELHRRKYEKIAADAPCKIEL